MSTPTQRSLALLRAEGLQAAVVEKWNPHARIRQDLFGCLDIIALGDGKTIGVQTTTRGNIAARARKVTESDIYPALIRAGWDIIIHGWAKDKSGRWQVKVLAL